MKCKFKQVGFSKTKRKNIHQCINTGCSNIAYTNYPSDEIRGNCLGYNNEEEISLGKKIKNYTKATKRWIKKGSTKRTDEEVNHIYDDICKPCQHFVKKSCKLCGCKVSKSKSGLTNKIRMATENCPIKKW